MYYFEGFTAGTAFVFVKGHTTKPKLTFLILSGFGLDGRFAHEIGRVSYFLLPNLESNQPLAPARVSFAWAVLACSLVLLWQFLTVHYNRSGNWTALFCTGQNQPVPPELAAQTYRFPGTNGYDGQMYRYVAHDPFLQKDFARFIDSPVLRYRRILVPGLAFLLAGGRQPWIDASYVAVVAAFTWLGSYWLSRYAAALGFHPAWALAFLLVPATLVSMDRMTVDGALAALTAGFAYFSVVRSSVRLYVVLMLACLTRETGVLLLAGCCLSELAARHFARALVWSTSCLPALGWYLFLNGYIHVAAAAPGIPRWVYRRLGPGILGRLFHPLPYPFPRPVELLAQSLDVMALTGIILAVLAAILLWRVRPLNANLLAAACFAALAAGMINPHFWDHCYNFARVFSPLLLLIIMEAMAWRPRRSWWWLAVVPAGLVVPRVALELGSQALVILRGLMG